MTDETPSVARDQKYFAEAEYFKAQTAGQRIDNTVAEALAESAKIALQRELRKEVWDDASDSRHRVYQLVDDIDSASVGAALDVLTRWERIDADNPDREWVFVICSSGGNVVAGIKLYALLKSLSAKRKITTVASGMCASMATVIHQAGTHRVIEPGTSYLLHDVSGGMQGNISNMQDTMAWLKMINHRLHIALAEKSKKSIEEIEKLCERRDAWFMAEDVVEMGLADSIGYAL